MYVAEEMWETILGHGLDCIFEDRLPASEEYLYTEVPLSTVPELDPAAKDADGKVRDSS